MSTQTTRWLVAACCVLSAGWASAVHAEVAAAPALEVGSYTPTYAAGSAFDVAKAVRRASYTRPMAAPVALDALDVAAVRSATGQQNDEGAVRIGLARQVGQTATVSATSALLDWASLSDGRQQAAISFSSPGAQGLRIGLLVEKLPPGALLRVYRQGDAAGEVSEFSANEIQLAVQRNLNAGDSSVAARTYWFPAVAGSEATLEIEIAAAVDTGSVGVAVPALSHLFEGAVEATLRSGAACSSDPACDAGYASASNSVAIVTLVRSGTTYVCTGTLLNDANSTGTPHFFTSRNCVPDQTAASTVTTTWFYRNNACGGQFNENYVVLAGGASMLYADENLDAAFMQLNGTPPAGATFSGWSTSPPNKGNAVASIYQPNGEIQKISYGTMSGYSSCLDSLGGAYTNCYDNRPHSSSNRLQVNWTAGAAGTGSAGAPLFLNRNGTHLFVGAFAAGSSSCSNQGGSDYYGRFDLAYFSGSLAKWLDPGSVANLRAPIYRFYNSDTSAHFYTINEIERDYVMATWPQFGYEGTAFYAYATAETGTSPIYRFFNTQTNSHFYTIDELERDYVIATWPQFQYEGVAWYARTQEGDGALPLYRFYYSEKGFHFYTISAGEMQAIIDNWPVYHFEGPGYYAWTSQ